MKNRIRLFLFCFFGAVLAADSAAAESAVSFPASQVKAVLVTGADWQVSFQARPKRFRRNKRHSIRDSYLFEIQSGGATKGGAATRKPATKDVSAGATGDATGSAESARGQAGGVPDRVPDRVGADHLKKIVSLSADGTVIIQENRRRNRQRNLHLRFSQKIPQKERNETEEKSSEQESKNNPDAPFAEAPKILKVTGPGEAALSLFLLRGKAQIIGWKGPVFIFSPENTEVSGEKSQGAWRLSLRRGRVNLQTHKGELDLQGFHLETSLKKQQGSVRLQFNEGYLKVSEGEGDLSWTTDRGETDLRDWKGDLKGESVSGKISGKNLRPKTARLFSKKGTLALRFASRPLLDINSASGTIRAPRYMNKKRAGRALAVSGRLRGTGPREGEVFIKTESGTVFVR